MTTATLRSERGFTIVEVLIAIIVLTVGLLGLMGTSALVTRMIARGQRSAVASIYAADRFEQLRATGCITRSNGTETFYRGSTTVGRNDWTWAAVGGTTDMYRLTVQTTYTTTQGRQRTENMETTISCVR